MLKMKGTRIHKFIQTGAWKGGILKGGIRIRQNEKDHIGTKIKIKSVNSKPLKQSIAHH